jgi:hypothetical protein
LRIQNTYIKKKKQLYLVSQGEWCRPVICQETEARGSRVWSWPELHSEFQVNLSYIVRPCLKKNLVSKIQITDHGIFTAFQTMQIKLTLFKPYEDAYNFHITGIADVPAKLQTDTYTRKMQNLQWILFHERIPENLSYYFSSEKCWSLRQRQPIH